MAQAGAVETALANAVEAAVLHVDVVDVVGVVKTVEQQAVLALVAGDVLHVDVADGGVEPAAAVLLRLVVEVDAHHGLTALANFNLAHVDVLYHAATA